MKADFNSVKLSIKENMKIKKREVSNSVYYNIPKGVEKVSKKIIIKLALACLIGLLFLLCEVVGGILA